MKIVVTGGSGFIGTNMVEHLADSGYEVLNLDKNPPKSAKHIRVFRKTDILEEESLARTMMDFAPRYVIHLAARTDLLETRTIDGYAANILGVENVCHACLRVPALERVIFTSSMLVCRGGYVPHHDLDTCPINLYGESKVVGETIVRNCSGLFGRWTLIRPTSIWGPWFGEPYLRFFMSIARGRYRHCRGTAIYKPFGYVGNVVEQVRKLMEADAALVAERTFYLADEPAYSIREWADTIARQLGRNRIREIGYPLLKAAALAGDCARALVWKQPPLTSFRLRNMLTESRFDLTELASIAGPVVFRMPEGVAGTIEWLRTTGSVPA
jgi:nucleoside-diphosphate-sugar epimerase